MTDLCRYEEISSAIYSSHREFMEAGKGRLRGDTTRDATKVEGEKLRRENSPLKMVVGDHGFVQPDSCKLTFGEI